MELEHPIHGIHHITLVAGNAARTARFYTQVLGMKFVKRTVNFDRPNTYHLYFGDDTGLPGTLVTFFEWPDAPPARMGLGSVHHLALTVDSMEALLQWKTWLQHHHMLVAGPFDHQAYRSLVFTDPDGVILEIATAGPGWQDLREGNDFLPPSSGLAAETWPEPVTTISASMRLGLLHHIAALTADIDRTHDFYEDLLCMPRLHTTTDPDSHEAPRWYWSTQAGNDAGRPGTVVIYTQPQSVDAPIRGQVGHGMTHHVAFGVQNDEALHFWRERLLKRGLKVTDVLDRKYFHSIYFRDPDNILIEIATAEPGFLIDQPADRLGKDLMLPSWLEPERPKIEASLPPMDVEY
jgi:glyoxalase family protein